MSDLNVTTIQNNNITKTDKLLAFNNSDSKAASIQDVVQLVPGKMAVATCSTAGNVATKAVTCADWNNKPGMSILVEFSNANSADNVTLSINSGTAIPVYYMNTATEQVSGAAIPAGAVVFTLNAAGNKFYANTPGEITSQYIGKVEQFITLAVGENTITFQTNKSYLLVSSGSNYAQGICFVTQGYNVAVLKNSILSDNIDFGSSDYSAVKTMIVKNYGGGPVELKIIRLW